jgi:hypothetical protein
MMSDETEERQLNGLIDVLVPFTSDDGISSSCSRPTSGTTTRSARIEVSGSSRLEGHNLSEH